MARILEIKNKTLEKHINFSEKNNQTSEKIIKPSKNCQNTQNKKSNLRKKILISSKK